MMLSWVSRRVVTDTIAVKRLPFLQIKVNGLLSSRLREALNTKALNPGSTISPNSALSIVARTTNSSLSAISAGVSLFITSSTL